MSLGDTGKWLFIPVTAAVGLVGAFLIYLSLPELINHVLKRVEVMTLNGVAHILTQEPSQAFMETYPRSHYIPSVPRIAQLVIVQDAILLVTGLWSVLALLCPFPFMALTLYYFGCLYLGIWSIIQMCAFYCQQNAMLLDAVPKFREATENQWFFFGQVEWPESFWYNFLFKSALNFYMVYKILNLYYSWYLILTVGGSGWELLRAQELPGWEKYQRKLQEKEEQKYRQMRNGLQDDDPMMDLMSGHPGHPGHPADPNNPHGAHGHAPPTQEELHQLLAALMGGMPGEGQPGENGVQPDFGDSQRLLAAFGRHLAETEAAGTTTATGVQG